MTAGRPRIAPQEAAYLASTRSSEYFHGLEVPLYMIKIQDILHDSEFGWILFDNSYWSPEATPRYHTMDMDSGF